MLIVGDADPEHCRLLLGQNPPLAWTEDLEHTWRTCWENSCPSWPCAHHHQFRRVPGAAAHQSNDRYWSIAERCGIKKCCSVLGFDVIISSTRLKWKYNVCTVKSQRVHVWFLCMDSRLVLIHQWQLFHCCCLLSISMGFPRSQTVTNFNLCRLLRYLNMYDP